jgi:hypothetical protein
VFLSCLLVCTSGTVSGLTVGCFSLDESDLATYEQRYPSARGRIGRLRGVLKKQNRLLCTLLLVNTTSNLALPMFLDPLVPAWLSLLLSVSAVLIFGEILPQAACIGPRKVPIIAWLSTFLRVVMFVTYPIAKPLSRLLDHIVGKKAALPEEATSSTDGPKRRLSGGKKDEIAMHAFGTAGWAKMIDKVAMDAFDLHGADRYRIQIVPIGEGATREIEMQGGRVVNAAGDDDAASPDAVTAETKSTPSSTSGMLSGPRSDEFVA